MIFLKLGLGERCDCIGVTDPNGEIPDIAAADNVSGPGIPGTNGIIFPP